MKIAVLQFAPRLGALKSNMQRADQLLEANQTKLDLLVLPEMAFSGYNFPNVEAVRPFLEPTTQGPTTHWAKRVAQTRQCTVIVGYPEIATEQNGDISTIRNYNSTVTVGPDGTILANYRKSFLYYTDETWAEEGFKSTPTGMPFFAGQLGTLGNVGHGICMDINPYQFTAPWTNYEFASTMLRRGCKLVVLSMAWLTRLSPAEMELNADIPDMETVAYWLERFWPFQESQPSEPIVVVLANRCGSEGTVIGSKEMDHGETIDLGDRVAYAGSSCVMKFQNGLVKLWEHHVGPHKGDVGLLGKGEEALLVIDTSSGAGFQLQPKASYA